MPNNFEIVINAEEFKKKLDLKDGRDGKDGVSGRDGVGIKGNDGKDGSPDTSEQVRDKLELLRDDERLDISAIKGTEKLTTNENLDRAISILDERTQYLINKNSTNNSSSSTPTSQTPWTSDIDADGFNLSDLGSIGFRTLGELKGNYMALGTTSFHGSGLNDLTYSGAYSGTGTPTYRFTVTNLSTQHISVDDASNIFVGDSITGDQSGSTGTVISSDGASEIILDTITGDFSTDFSITDTTTSATVNVNQVDAFVDLGTFTDGTTTLTLQAVKGRTSTLQGVGYSVSAFTGHTVTNYWEMTITPTLADGLKLDFTNKLFSMGDHEQKTYGNEYLTDISSGVSRWQMKDKLGTYFSMKASGQNPTFSGLGGSGAGRFVGLDNSGVMSNVASPLSIGAPVGGSSANGFYLFANGAGQLAQGSTNTGIQQISTNLQIYARGFFVSDQSGNLFYDFDLIPGAQAFRIGDLSGAGSGAKLNMDIPTGVTNFTTNATFNVQNVSGTPTTYFSVAPTLETVSILGGLVVTNQYETPSTGDTITVAEKTTTLTIDPAGLLAALTITFPTAYDGRVVEFNSTQVVTALTLSGGTFVGAMTTIGVAGFAKYVYSSGDSKWHRQG